MRNDKTFDRRARAPMVMVHNPLFPCLCGNFGDDGPDDLCDRPCAEEYGETVPSGPCGCKVCCSKE